MKKESWCLRIKTEFKELYDRNLDICAHTQKKTLFIAHKTYTLVSEFYKKNKNVKHKRCHIFILLKNGSRRKMPICFSSLYYYIH